MSTVPQRVVMLIGARHEARSWFSAALYRLGWTVIPRREADVHVAADASEQQLVEAVGRGQEVVLDAPNTSSSERQTWFRALHHYLRHREHQGKSVVRVWWIGVILDLKDAMDGASSTQILPNEGFAHVLHFMQLPPDPTSYFGPPMAQNRVASDQLPPDPQLTTAVPLHAAPKSPSGAVSSIESFEWNEGDHLRDVRDDEIVLLFDLNGTLNSHTSKRKSSGRMRIRPGIEHLMRLQGRFRLGIYSSSTVRTVDRALQAFGQVLGKHIFDPDLIFFRKQTMPVDKRLARDHGLMPWDTVKPLKGLFPNLRRVILFDDDPWKAVQGEQNNMVVVPCWRWDDPEDSLLPILVGNTLMMLETLSERSDVRDVTRKLTAVLEDHVRRSKEGHVVPLSKEIRKAPLEDRSDRRPRTVRLQ